MKYLKTYENLIIDNFFKKKIKQQINDILNNYIKISELDVNINHLNIDRLITLKNDDNSIIIASNTIRVTNFETDFENYMKISDEVYNNIVNSLKSYKFQKNYVERGYIKDLINIYKKNIDFINEDILKEYRHIRR